MTNTLHSLLNACVALVFLGAALYMLGVIQEKYGKWVGFMLAMSDGFLVVSMLFNFYDDSYGASGVSQLALFICGGCAALNGLWLVATWLGDRVE